MNNACWRINSINDTPHTTHTAIVGPEPQAHVAPPKVRMSMNRTNTSAFKTAPTQSVDLRDCNIVWSLLGRKDGKINRYTGDIRAARGRLM